MEKKPSILLIAGEHSGDILGGHLARALQQHLACNLTGIGSQHMKAAGVRLIYNSDELAVMGAVEVIKKIRVLKKVMRLLTTLLKNNPPDLLILIDYPGFNLRVAKRAKQHGVKVMYYVSPQIWAWHYSRIQQIKQHVDLMAVLYAFEEKIYKNENVPVRFVGHPLIESMQPTLNKEDAYHTFKLNPNLPIIGLLPGSRKAEIKRLLPIMLQCANTIKLELPQAQFILPLSTNLQLDTLKPYDLTGITVITNNTYNAMQLCDAAIVTSGTVTLEVAVLEVPEVIIYKVNVITAWIGRIITNIKQIGLCNIVAEETVALELLQEKVNCDVINQEIIRLIKDKSYSDTIKQKLIALKHKLQSENASLRAAKAALSLLNV